MNRFSVKVALVTVLLGLLLAFATSRNAKATDFDVFPSGVQASLIGSNT